MGSIGSNAGNYDFSALRNVFPDTKPLQDAESQLEGEVNHTVSEGTTTSASGVRLEDVRTDMGSSGLSRVGLESHAPVDTIESDWVDLLDDTYRTDTANAKEQLKADMEKEKPPAYGTDLDSPQNAREIMLGICKSVHDKILDEGDLKAKMARCEEAVSKAIDDEKDPNKRMALQDHLLQVQQQYKELLAAREKLVSFIPTEKRKSIDFNPDSKEEDKRALREMKDAFVAIRNFRYDMQRTHGKFGFFSKIGAWLGRSFFTTTKNPFFRWFQNKFSKVTIGKDDPLTRINRIKDNEQTIHKADFQEERSKAVTFADSFNALLKHVGRSEDVVNLGPRDPQYPDEPSAHENFVDEVLEDLFQVEDGLSVKSGNKPTFSYHIEQGLMEALEPLSHEEGSNDFVLGIKAGVVVPIPVAKLSVGAKFEYAFRVTGNGNGGITIERLKMGGAQGRAGVELAPNAKLVATGEFIGGKGNSTEFADVKSAVKSFKGGALGLIQSFMVRGADILHFLSLGAKLVTNSGKSFDDVKFLKSINKRGLLPNADKILGKRSNNNKVFGGKRTFSRIRFGAGAHTKAQFVGALNFKGEINGKAERDFKATRTNFSSYYTYFTTQHAGKATETYEMLCAGGEERFENHAKMHELLKKNPTTQGEKIQFANDIIAEMKEMIRREDAYMRELSLRDDADIPSNEEICEDYRRATIAMVALQDKLKAIEAPLTEELQKSYEDTRTELQNILESPGIDMPDEVLQEELYVSKDHDDGKWAIKGHFYVSLNTTTEIGNQVLLNSPLESNSWNVGNELLRTGTQGIIQGGGNALGLNPSLEVNVTYDIPKGDDPRPFRQMNSVTLDFRPQKNLTVRSLITLIKNAYERAAKEPESGLEENGLDTESILKFLGAKVGAGAGSHVFFETVDAMMGGNPNDHIRGANFLADSILDQFTWESQDLIRLKFEDGRLSFVGFGDAETFHVGLNEDIGFVSVGGEVKQNKETIRKSFWETPSFDALTSKCDEMRRLGHDIKWKQFSMAHKDSFVRLARILGGDRSFVSKAGHFKNNRIKDDTVRLQKCINRMRSDINNQKFKPRRDRLQANLEQALEVCKRLQNNFKKPKEEQLSEDLLVENMRMLFEAVADHYNILESGAAKGGKLGETLMKGYEFSDRLEGNAEDNAEWISIDKKV